MDFSASSPQLTNGLTPQQLHELHFLQQQQHDDFFKPQSSLQEDVNMGGNSSNSGISAESIFWEDNYTSQQLHVLSDGRSSLSDSLSPSIENVIDSCIKKETANEVKANDLQQQQLQQQNISEEELYLRRKAQNRALQRLFRERKESKLKELSSKLSQTEQEKEKLMRELEALRRQNTLLVTENHVLLKSGTIVSSNASSPEEFDEFSFPLKKEMFINDFVLGTDHDLESAFKYDKLVYQHDGSKMLSIGAVWDYLLEYSAQNEELEIDIGEVINYIKGSAKCHGYGPGFSLDVVKELIGAVTGEKLKV